MEGKCPSVPLYIFCIPIKFNATTVIKIINILDLTGTLTFIFTMISVFFPPHHCFSYKLAGLLTLLPILYRDYLASKSFINIDTFILRDTVKRQLRPYVTYRSWITAYTVGQSLFLAINDNLITKVYEYADVQGYTGSTEFWLDADKTGIAYLLFSSVAQFYLQKSLEIAVQAVDEWCHNDQ